MKKTSKTLFWVLTVIILILGVVFFIQLKNPSPNFTVEDWATKINFSTAQDYSGAVAVNLDSDPDLEFLVGAIRGPNLMFEFSQGRFQPLDIPLLANIDGYTLAIIPCDLDADGRDEIIYLNEPINDSSVSLLLKFENNKWINSLAISAKAMINLKNANAGSCIDRTGTGKYGIALTSSTGPISFLEIRDGKLEDISEEVGLGIMAEGKSINGVPGPQGFTNIFVGTDKANLYFVNNGSGKFTENAKKLKIDDPQFKTRGLSTVDLNHDEIPDVVYGNHFGPLRLLTQDRSGSFSDITPEDMKNTYAVNSALAADLNLDGYEDLYLNNIRNANILFAGNKNGWVQVNEALLLEKDLFGIGSLAGDLDGSPGFELLNTHGDGKKFSPRLYHIKPESSWISIDVKYPNGGVPRGAVVRLRTSEKDRLRVIDSGSGRFANYTPDLIFGLLPNEKVMALEVTVPSGLRREYKMDFKLNQKHHLKLNKQ